MFLLFYLTLISDLILIKVFSIEVERDLVCVIWIFHTCDFF